MDIETVLKGITAIREQIHKQHLWNDPVALSDKMTKLSVYNSYLADHIAPLHAQATQSASVAFKAARDMEASVTESERLAKAETVSQREAYENIKYVYTATTNLISVLQSRLRVIENTRKQEGV